jgi:uncharacterized protein YaiL (DUF2058 family)
MSRQREQRELKEVKTRHLKQEIETLKLDLLDAQEEYNDIYNNLMKCVQLLEETVDFTKGKLKYDSKKITSLCKKIYKFE